jgi:hypothetical protein
MRRLIPLVLLALSALSCSSDTTAPNATNSALFRVVHGSPDAGAFDVFISGTLAVQTLAYASASSYVQLTVGSSEIQVRQSGAVNQLLDISPSFAAGSVSTLALTGTNGALESTIFADDTTTPPSGTIKLRLVHLAPLGPAVDLYVTGATDDIASISPTIGGVTYKTASSYATPANPGTLRLRVTQAGTKTVLVDSGSLTLTSGQSLSLYVFGKAGAGGGGAPYSAQLF